MRVVELVRVARATAAGWMLCGWGVAWATVEVVPPDLLGLPWVQIAIGASGGGWGGLVSTLVRYTASRYDNRITFYWRPEALKDVTVGATAGYALYLWGSSARLSPEMIGLLIVVGGGAGTRLWTLAVDMIVTLLRRREGDQA